MSIYVSPWKCRYIDSVLTDPSIELSEPKIPGFENMFSFTWIWCVVCLWITVGKEDKDMPYLLFLQGGPGFECGRPTEAGGWMKKACEEYRLVLLDQACRYLLYLFCWKWKFPICTLCRLMHNKIWHCSAICSIYVFHVWIRFLYS